MNLVFRKSPLWSDHDESGGRLLPVAECFPDEEYFVRLFIRNDLQIEHGRVVHDGIHVRQRIYLRKVTASRLLHRR